MDDQFQKLPRHELLAALLEDGDFWEGLQLGYQAFQDRLYSEFQERRWTQKDLITFVERELSGKLYRREEYIARLNGWLCHSYLYVLGFVLAYLNQALAAKMQAQASKLPEPGSDSNA
ncbi:MAG: hypothetical protein IMW89_20895 [Ktedonobacteraceae bacterium]|nr:hypothetical protein [Ktedonobacteraceae bacterium]